MSPSRYLLNFETVGQERELLRTEVNLPQALRVRKIETCQAVSQKLAWTPSKEQDDPELGWTPKAVVKPLGS